MNKTLKDTILMLLMVLPLFGGLFAWWLYSPMYKAFLNEQRINAQNYLIRNYYYKIDGKADMMDFYGLTDNDTNPSKIMNRWIAENESLN